jgi:hypothetical protein
MIAWYRHKTLVPLSESDMQLNSTVNPFQNTIVPEMAGREYAYVLLQKSG